MKAVMISIRPEWCEKIASGEKTVEVRKTRPKLKPPFKCYIYCTKGKGDCLWRWNGIWYDTQDPNHRPNRLDGMVIGEFVCHWIRRESEVALGFVDVVLAKTSCMGYRQIMDYADGGDLYTWNISDLVIYDKPRPLSDFKPPCDGFDKRCQVSCALITTDGISRCTRRQLTRPPQSWCYVEEGGAE